MSHSRLNKHFSVIRLLELNRIFILFVCSYDSPMVTKHYVGKQRGSCEYNINMYYFILVWYNVMFVRNNICALKVCDLHLSIDCDQISCFLFAATYSWKCWLLLDTCGSQSWSWWRNCCWREQYTCGKHWGAEVGELKLWIHHSNLFIQTAVYFICCKTCLTQCDGSEASSKYLETRVTTPWYIRSS